jgi:hypothetical protein
MIKCASGIVGRAYVDAFYLFGIEGQDTFVGFKIVALDYDVPGVAVAVTVFFFFDKQAVFCVGGGFDVLLSGAPVKDGHKDIILRIKVSFKVPQSPKWR